MVTGGGKFTDMAAKDYTGEIAAAAVDETNAVIVYNGMAILAPMKDIDSTKTELACNGIGTALIQDDGNSENDITIDVNNPNIHYHADGTMHVMPSRPRTLGNLIGD